MERHNPRAFSVANLGRTKKAQQRNLDIAQRKEVVPQVHVLSRKCTSNEEAHLRATTAGYSVSSYWYWDLYLAPNSIRPGPRYLLCVANMTVNQNAPGSHPWTGCMLLLHLLHSEV